MITPEQNKLKEKVIEGNFEPVFKYLNELGVRTDHLMEVIKKWETREEELFEKSETFTSEEYQSMMEDYDRINKEIMKYIFPTE